jgi:hypothetical protein
LLAAIRRPCVSEGSLSDAISVLPDVITEYCPNRLPKASDFGVDRLALS